MPAPDPATRLRRAVPCSASVYATDKEASHGKRSNLGTSREARPAHRAKRPARFGVRLPRGSGRNVVTDASHVRDAVARFDQWRTGQRHRALAFANIQKAAGYYGVNLSETDWHQLGSHPQQDR